MIVVQQMNQLSLLRDYVTTMQRQLQSKNQQLKTLTSQNQKLLRQNQQLSMKKSFVLNTSSCENCTNTKRQLNELQNICNQLQYKYDNLQRQKSVTSSSSVRVLSTSCSDCSRIKGQFEDLKIKYQNLQKYDSNKLSTTKVYTTMACNQCPRLRSQIKAKDDTIMSLRSQISTYNGRILSLEGQIATLQATMPKPIVYTQNSSRPNDLQRIAYLNGQVEQYMALVNSLRSQIKVINEQNQRYILRIRDYQTRPRQVQYIQKQMSQGIRDQMRSLKIQVGELSNDNILLRRQNASLKREIMNLPKSSQVIIQSNIREKPKSYSPINYYQDRQGRHFRKSTIGKRNQESQIFIQNIPYPQKIKHDDLQRKIQMLQMENEYLKGTFYSQI